MLTAIIGKIGPWVAGLLTIIGATFGLHRLAERRRLKQERLEAERDALRSEATALGLTLDEWEAMNEQERKRRRDDAFRSPADKLRDAGRGM